MVWPEAGGLAPFLASASATSLAFLSFEASGEYLERRERSFEAWFLSIVYWNWLRAGGDLSLKNIILFYLWILMYFGHLTNLVRFLTGWISPPTLKFLGDLAKRDEPVSLALAPADVTVFLTTFFGILSKV